MKKMKHYNSLVKIKVDNVFNAMNKERMINQYYLLGKKVNKI